MFETNCGYVLGEIKPKKNAIDGRTQIQEIWWERQDLYGLICLNQYEIGTPK